MKKIDIPSPFDAADNFLLDRIVSPLAWKYEYKTGRTNLWLARKAAGIAIAGSVADAIMTAMSDHDYKLMWALPLLVGVLLFLRAVIKRLDRQTRRNWPARSAVAGQYRLGYKWFRLVFFWLFFVFFAVIELPGLNLLKLPVYLASSGTSLAMAMLWYLMAVNVPPPKPQKQEKLDKNYAWDGAA